jgi:hypothetical protein
MEEIKGQINRGMNQGSCGVGNRRRNAGRRRRLWVSTPERLKFHGQLRLGREGMRPRLPQQQICAEALNRFSKNL